MTTMKTPAGDTIEVVSDADFVEVYDISPIDLRIWNPKRPMLEALWREGAVIDRKSGRAARMLWERAKSYGYEHGFTGIGSLMQQPAIKGMLDRDLAGKRTFRIQLVRLPESYVDRLQALTGPPAEEVRKESEPPQPVAVPDVPGVPTVANITEDVASAVARELLAEVVRVINTPPPEPPAPVVNVDPEVRERLAKALEYGERVRKELREVGDELRATKQERDALRQGLKLMEANFDKALGDGRRYVDEEVQKQLSKFMSGKPMTKGNDDAD